MAVSSLLRGWNILLLLSVFGASVQAFARPFEVLQQVSLGRSNMPRQSRAWASAQQATVLVNGEIESQPTTEIIFDRALLSYTDMSLGGRMTEKVGLRFDAGVAVMRRLEEDEEVPRTITERNSSEITAALQLDYYSQTDLRLFIGYNYLNVPRSELFSESLTVAGKTTFRAYDLQYYHLGLVKSLPVAAIGFYYMEGKETKQSIRSEQTVAGNTDIITGEQGVDSPETIGIFTRMQFGATGVSGEFTDVRAGSTGAKTASGDSVEEDYTRAMLGGDWELKAIGGSLELFLVYKSLAYSSSNTVTLDTISQFGLHLYGYLGSPEQHVFAGLIFGAGADRQSAPEFNADFSYEAYGGTVGARLSI